MFEKISKSRLKKILVAKYFFQFFIAPLMMGAVFILIAFLLEVFISGFHDAVFIIFIETSESFRVPNWTLLIMFMFLINLVNILSVIPFIKLLLDCINRDSEVTREINFYHIFPYYELQCIRQSKRFMCDTFSRKNNAEMFLYDENKEKFRFIWNENYGDVNKYEELKTAQVLSITYLKRSKIIIRCDVIKKRV